MSPAARRRADPVPLRPSEDPGPPRLVAVPPLPGASGDDGIPEPHPDFVRALAVQGYEVIEGSRTLSQLGSLITVGLARSLSEQRASAGDRRTVYRDTRVGRPFAAGVRIDRPREDVAEAVVVLHLGKRARAVAVRLEWAHRHWRASDLALL